MLEKRFIQSHTLSYGISVIFVSKKDGTKRMCINYRWLRDINIKNKYALPNINGLFDRLQEACIFSKANSWFGYHQIRVKDEDVHKTAFRMHIKHFGFKMLSFGLTNAPTTFVRLIHDILRPVLYKFVVMFLDDILAYSKSEEHVEHLK
jgi:hypothetical protein